MSEVKKIPSAMIRSVARKGINSILEKNPAFDFEKAFNLWNTEKNEPLEKYDWNDPKVRSWLEDNVSVKTSSKSQPTISESNASNQSGNGKIYVAPDGVRAKGQFDVITTDKGIVFRKTKKTKNLAIKCGKGAKGKKLNEDEIVCELDAIPDAPKKKK